MKAGYEVMLGFGNYRGHVDERALNATAAEAVIFMEEENCEDEVVCHYSWRGNCEREV